MKAKSLTYNTKLSNIFILLVVFFMGISVRSIAQTDLPQKPDLETSVYDNANLLTASQKNALEQKLINYADTTSTQIVVTTINSLEGHNINLYAAEWAHSWGIGQADKDNGVLFLIAKEDRKMAIQVGYGLEHLLTDALSRRIIELIVAPEFKKGDYYQGINAGTTAMMDVLSGSYKADDISETGSFWPFLIFLLFFILIIIIISKANKGNTGGGYRNTSGPLIFTSSGRTGGFGGGFGSGGGSFGGGGFGGGFGGGGFGGGGASGGW